MSTLLLRRLIALSLLIGFLYSCNKDSELNQTSHESSKSKLRVKKSKEEKEKKAKGYADFMKNITTPMNEEKSGYDEGHFFKEFLKAKKHKEHLVASKQANASFKAFSDGILWKERGPGNVPGRLRQIAIHPTNKDTWYLGTVGGGVWKTEDAGGTFTNLTDFKIPNLATSSVVISAANPSTVYAGTGEPFSGFGMISGIGIIKSTDEGKNWTLLENTSVMGDIARMFINQTDENIVVAATSSGVYKTTDGGASWTQTYSDGKLQDLKAAPTDPNILYAFDSTQKNIIKSTDQGDTWTTVYAKMNNDSRIELAISHQDPNKVYGSVFVGNQDLIILSTDGGASWNLVNENEENLANFSSLKEFMGGQGWYDNTINVHPTDDNIIYVGGVNLFKMTISEVENSFERFTEPITDVYGNFYPQTGKNYYIHPDQHTIEYIYGENGEFQLIVGNDGGVAISNMGTDPGFEEGDWVTGTVTGLNNTQFYGADKRNGVDQYIAGAQDNGTFVSPENPTATSNYSFGIGGDGFECVWNYEDPNKVLGASQFNGLAVSLDGGKNFTRNNVFQNDGPFLSRFANAKNNPDIVFAIGSRGVYKTIDFGINWQFKPISFELGSAEGDVAVSTAKPSIVWAGKASGNFYGDDLPLFVSTDEGETFNPVYPKYTGLAYISGIETHYTEPNTAYLLMSVKGHSKIMRTEDLGETWEDITGFAGDGSPSTNGFPDVPTYSLLTIPNTNVLWAGTEIGIFQSLDNGASWEYLDENIPAVSVWDMKVVNNQIVIATHGRGVWTATVPELEGYEPPAYMRMPQITEGKQVWGKNTITIQYNLNSPYDETKIFLNDEEFETLPANANKQIGLTKEIELPSDITEARIKLISKQGEKTRITKEVTIPLMDFESSSENYINDFSSKLNMLGYDFSNPLNNNTKGFGRFYVEGWSTGDFMLNEDIYYSENTQYIAMVSNPILIRGDETSVLDFLNIALVEVGDETSIWDYVVVEATKDGENWIEITEQYDARAYPDWVEAYEISHTTGELAVDESQYRQKTVDLNQYFKNGDLVLIRFKLFSDPAVTSFGWFIDDVKIQANIPTEGADLTPTNMIINPDPLNLGENGDFSFTIANTGDQDATATTASLYYSSSNVFNDEAILIGSHTINALAAGAEEIYNETFSLPSTMNAGNYYIHYKVDTENTIMEISEANNFTSQATSLIPFAKNADNYIIKVENETCENKNNGSIDVTAKETLNYTYTLSSDTLSKEGTFTSVLSFDNLAAGTYTLCFGLENSVTYKQCFDIVIGEPSNLLASTTVNKSSRTVTVNIAGGTAPYKINLNGRTYSVNTKSIDLPLTEGDNTIAISSDIVCEGTVVDVINTQETTKVTVYPNPVENQLFINIPTNYSDSQIPIQIYNANGQLVLNNIYAIHNSKIEVNATSLGSGLYIVKVGNLDTIKIIKK